MYGSLDWVRVVQQLLIDYFVVRVSFSSCDLSNFALSKLSSSK